MQFLDVYSWDQYTIPSGIPPSDLTGDTHPNDPNPSNPIYVPGETEWIGETFTFNGGAPTQIEITDDDSVFQDGYVETGSSQTLTVGVTINSTFYPAGSLVENEFSLEDSSGQEIYVIRIAGENVGFVYASADAPTSGETFTAQSGLDGDPSDNPGGVGSSSEPYANLMCFAEGTRIETPDGPRLVETLRAGDLVLTQDSGPVEILWCRRHHQPLDSSEADGLPILIHAGAFAPNCPDTDLIVSPQHRILVGPHQLSDIFEEEALAPAKSLTDLPRVRQMRGKSEVSWVHFACARHEIVMSNACLSESLLLGPMVLNGLTQQERTELETLFPSKHARALNGPSARQVLTVRAARYRIKRHKRRKSPRRLGAFDGLEWSY